MTEAIMNSNDIAEKGGLLSDVDEKGSPVHTGTSETPARSLMPRITLNRRQKVILAIACLYYPILAWSIYKGHTRVDLVDPAGTAVASDAYLEGLSGQGWSFLTMQDRIEQSSTEQGVFFSQTLNEHKKGDDHKHGHHKHHRPPFRHITPAQAEEIFFKVPNNDSAAA